MVCKSCQSAYIREFPAEIEIQFPGKQNLDKKPVWVFEKLMICLRCGFTEFRIPEAELRSLVASTPRPNSAHDRQRRYGT